jgi:predicted acylesterase/phospholipase RssA
MMPTEIVIGSGGSRGIIALGAAFHLKKHGYFERATTYSGTSVGAVIAVGLALGIDPRRMLRVASASPIDPDISPRNFGMDSGKGLVTWLRRMLRVPRKMTLQNLYEKTRKTVRICVCNVTDRRVEYWTHETHPEMPVLKALRISCSVPLIFSAVTHDTKMFVDGAVVDPLPVLTPEHALAIGFSKATKCVDTMQDFIEAIQSMRIHPSTPRYYVELDPGDLHGFDFSLDAATLKRSFINGRDQASSWIKKNV